jgi:hypothetical protein
MTKSFFILVGLYFLSSCSSTDCDCLEELNTMDHTSEKYKKCINIAYLNRQNDPYSYFKNRCENKKYSEINDVQNNESESTAIIEKPVPVKVKDLNKYEAIIIEDNSSIKSTSNKSIKNLLQGKWQSIDDKSSFIVFDKEFMIDIYKDKRINSEKYILADKCKTENFTDSPMNKEVDRYISCPKSDLCWYIDKINDSQLELIYLGRGNTLKYRKLIE